MQLSKPIECTTPRLNSDVNCGFWMIMTCQCRYIGCNNVLVGCRMLVKKIVSLCERADVKDTL